MLSVTVSFSSLGCVKGYLDEETEGFIMAAQEQALSANVVKSNYQYMPPVSFM